MTYLKKTVNPKEKPRAVGPTGVDGGRYAHAVGFRKEEMNRLQCVESK
jgi:hypothetical protein